MATKDYACEINWCNWELVRIADIQKTLILSTVYLSNNIDCDIDAIASFETSYICERGESGEGPLEFVLVANAEYMVRRLDIVSEASAIEVFGRGQEYLTTCHTDFCDDFEGMAVRLGKIIPAGVQPSITLRFTKTKEASRVAIYGIRVEIAPSLSPDKTCVLPLLSNVGKTHPMEQLLVKMNSLFDSEKSNNGTGGLPLEKSSKECNNCDNCMKAVRALEEKLSLRIAQMEANILDVVRKNHEEIKSLFKARNDL